MRRVLLLLIVLTGCTNYRNRFDCPPSPGVGCKSVSQIEAMILEKNGEEDLFVGLCPHRVYHDHSSTDDPPSTTKEQTQTVPDFSYLKKAKGKLWMNSYQLPGGERIDEHYIYLCPHPADFEGDQK